MPLPPADRAIEYFLTRLKNDPRLVSDLSRACDDPAMQERIEEWLESLAGILKGFGWRRCQGYETWFSKER